MPRQYVRCCDYNRENDNIYFDDDPHSPCFREARGDDPFQYCPWCGVLLDTNLPMTEAAMSDFEKIQAWYKRNVDSEKTQELLDSKDKEE